MPFTPLHMGPGLLIKAVLQGGFSLMVFGWAQILMDIQPLLAMVTGAGQLHGFSHTYLGAALLGAFSALSGKRLSEFGLLVLGVAKKESPIRISWPVAIASAFIGSFSHLMLDAVMHADVQPYFPFSADNGLFGLLDYSSLNRLCLLLGAAGAALFFGVQWWFRYRADSAGRRSR